MKRVGISSLYTQGLNIEILRPLRGLVGKCTIWLGIGERKYPIELKLKCYYFGVVASEVKPYKLEKVEKWKMD